MLVDTLAGIPVKVSVEMGNVYINDAMVAAADVEASNGVIHVIDAVILPEGRDIVDIAIEDGRFTTLVTAVEAAGLVEALKADGPLTVFAPTDEAFAALPEGTIEALLADLPALTDILLYHVVDDPIAENFFLHFLICINLLQYYRHPPIDWRYSEKYLNYTNKIYRYQ